MTVKFDHQAIATALEPASDGEVRVLTLTGGTFDGMPIEGQDCVVIIKKGPASKPSAETPTAFSLHNNYPNPFNPVTQISYDLPNDSWVKLSIYNVRGQKVTTLVDRFEASGYKAILWDGTDDNGNKLASGVYFYRIQADEFTATKSMVLMR